MTNQTFLSIFKKISQSMFKYQIELSLCGELSKQLNELRCYIIHLQCKYTAQQTFEKTESVRTIMPVIQLNLNCWK